MRERDGIEQLNSFNSSGNHLQLPSLSPSKVSNIQKLHSHIKSSLPHLQGKKDQKYVFVKMHNSFIDLREQHCEALVKMLIDQFDDRLELKYFKQTKELLQDAYNDHEYHYIIVPEKHLSWAETFAKQQRDESHNKKKIYVYGILKKSVFIEKEKIRSRKKIDKIPQYINHFYFEDEEFPEKITKAMEQHLELRIRQEGNHLKTWALSNKYAEKKLTRRTIHFFYETRMEKEFTGLYKTYKKKSNSSWIQICSYQNFEDVLKKIKDRETSYNKEFQTVKRVTSKILESSSRVDLGSNKSIFMDNNNPILTSSIIGNSIRAMNKLDQNDINIIICTGHHPDIQKFRGLVRVQRYGNWFLWEIEQGSSDFLTRLRQFLNEEVQNNEQFQAAEYQRIIHSKTLYIMALNKDLHTIEMFRQQSNILHNMELLIYNDSDEFSLLLREGVKSTENFVIAVVPGGFKSFATEYARVINEFDAKYKNVDSVQNFKFISNANGRHVSNLASSQILGTQSDLTYLQDNTYLENIMKERDKHFHPFEGLKGHSVYLLVQQRFEDLLGGLRDYIANSPRLHISTYIDKEYLKKLLDTIIFKDSAIVITDDTTLRDAQSVVRSYDEVFILNITDRDKIKEEVKVISSGPKEMIYDLIKEIPEYDDQLQDEKYSQILPQENYLRVNRVLPKKIYFRPGDTVAIRLPAKLDDDQSRKMEIRLQRHFNKELKIQYYKNPNDVRMANKLHEPLSFIIWADYVAEANQQRETRLEELDYLKELAVNEREELRTQFIVYSDRPKNYEYLTIRPDLERFKFVSNRWERIEQYIIGTYKKFVEGEDGEQWIYSDEAIRVFFDDKDKKSKELINAVVRKRNGEELNAANKVQFHIMEDLPTVLTEQSPSHKYFLVISQNGALSKEKALRMISSQEYAGLYLKLIVVQQDKAKRIETGDSQVRKVVVSEAAAGQWLSSIRVVRAEYEWCVPHVMIDRNSVQYYYFLDKYSKWSHRFTFGYFTSKDDLKKQVIARKRDIDQVWIIVKDWKAAAEYWRLLQRVENSRNVRFIVQSGDSVSNSQRGRAVFVHESKKEVQKFLLNIYRRDKHTFFLSSVSNPKVVLVILNGVNGKPIAVNRLQIKNWEDFIKAKILYLKDTVQLKQALKSLKEQTVYVVYPSMREREMIELTEQNSNIRRIVLSPSPEYNPRKLLLNFVENNRKIYIGTYPAEITDHLRFLRYNIRKNEQGLEKTVCQEIIELNIQKEYKLSQKQLWDISKNDSIIVNRNGYELEELPKLLNRSLRFSYLPIYVGDYQSSKQIDDFSTKKGKEFRFIDAQASPILYMQGDSKGRLLQTNQRDQLTTLLMNLPQHRYDKAKNYRGKFVLYYNSKDESLKNYVANLAKIRQRNANIVFQEYSTIDKLASTVQESGLVLIHNAKQKEYQDKIKPNSNINYWIAGEDYNSEKNYAGYGNKFFIAKKADQFDYFLSQVTSHYETNLDPIKLVIDDPQKQINNISLYKSIPIQDNNFRLKALPPFRPKSAQVVQQLLPLKFTRGILDENPPSLLKIKFPDANIPTLPLGPEIIKRIKDKIIPDNSNQPLNPGIDSAPSLNWFEIKSEPDSMTRLPTPIAIPRPVPAYKSKLAVLHPVSEEFTLIGDVLKNNLQPDQFLVTLIGFKSEHQLEEYSKNNGQRLNGYDKIVVFLSNAYRKYDQNLKVMKSKLSNRMEYFIFQDNFHINGHPALKNHLRPYKIKKAILPHKGQLPRLLTVMQKILIMVPSSLMNHYSSLKSGRVSVQPYGSNKEILEQIHLPNQFLIIICNREDYHALKIFPKSSPRCALIVDTTKDLPQDQLYLFRIYLYSIYYGNNAADWLAEIIPKKIGNGEETRILFYGQGEEQLVFGGDYRDYEKIGFRQWNQLYLLLAGRYQGCSNWLIKSSPGKPQLVSLHPKVYLQDKIYMRQFKNNYEGGGYLNGQRVPRKSALVLHEFSELPEVIYSDEKQLARLLEKQETPSVVLFDGSNVRVSSLRGRWNKHKWVGLTNGGERWIDWQGNLLEVRDQRLKRKQDMFANMFNWKVFDEFNDMQYYYLSNKANIDHNRNIYFRTKEQLLQTYGDNPNLLMVIFVESKDLSHVPQALLAEGSKENGRVKLILLKTEFVDDYDTLYIKFNEIDPVIRHINTLESAGRIDFIVYNESDGERNRQTLIQKKKLKNFENRPYSNFIQVQEIARTIKGRYRKAYVVCFPDEKNEIESILASYSIKNKGIPGEGVEFILIDRLSSIRPNPSHLSQLMGSPVGRAGREIFQRSDDAHYEAVDHAADALNEPNVRSNLKMESILNNKNFVLSIHDKLKEVFPVGKFFAGKVNYFSDVSSLAKPGFGVPQLVISGQKLQELQAATASSPETLVLFVSNDGNSSHGVNTMIIREQQVPNLIKRLEGNGDQDELNMKNLEQYSKVRVVYDLGIDSESKRKLLSASQRNHKIVPTIYKGVPKLKEYLKEPDSLLLLMMSYDPENLDAEVAGQNYVVVRKKKMKVIVPIKSESDVEGLETILQEEEIEAENEAVRHLTDEQVDIYLKIYENSEPEKWPKLPLKQKEEAWERQEQDNADLDNITKLNVHSNIQPKDLFNYQEIQKIKQRLTGDLIVVMIDKAKEKQFQEPLSRYNILLQKYTNSMNLQNDIRSRKDNVTLVIIDRNMVEKVIPIKKKYPHVTFILESDTPQEDLLEQYKPYIAGQIKKVSDLEKIIGQIYSQNDRIRYNAESVRVASRFDVRKTSIVDFSNNQRFTVGLSNQKSKKAFLFYRDPENNHVKAKLSQTFNNVSYIPYRSIADLKKLIGTYNGYTSILIANGQEIPEIEEYVSKKKEMIYVIRYDPPSDLRDNPRIKRLFSTYSKNDLQEFIFTEFQKNYISLAYDRSLDSKFKSNKNVQGKRYIQKYEPNTFGTTPRFSGDFVPPKSKESTYSRKYMKSTSRSKMSSRMDQPSPKGVSRNMDYFQT